MDNEENLPVVPAFNSDEARVIGCLMEKSVTTPDQYPLTLNALTNACNQKSARNPVMTLAPGTVQHTARELEARKLLRVEETSRRGVEKYYQRFCNTVYSNYQFEPPGFAIVCLLLLRGPQTPGELRAHSGRLYEFPDNAAVVSALDMLIGWDGGPLVVKLPRTPGRKDAEYMHLLCGAVDVEAHALRAQAASTTAAPARVELTDLAERVARLESELAEIRETLKTAL